MKEKLVNCLLIALLASLVMESGAAGKKTVRPLTIDVLKNATYKVLTDSKDTSLVELVNGEFRQKEWPPENPDYPYIVRLTDWVRFADLNGDSIDDVAVIYYWSGGGSGSFYWLGAVLNQDGKPEHVSSAHLGDRVHIDSLVINSGEIFLEMTPWDQIEAACCPTSQVERNYKLIDRELIESTDFTGLFRGETEDGSGVRMTLELNIRPNGTVTTTRKPIDSGQTIKKEGSWWSPEDGSIEIIFPKLSEEEGEDRITCLICRGKLSFCRYYEYIYGKNVVTLEKVVQ
ncbi:MAG: hypothetical protein A2Z27_04090 [candidate division Zixibacteria bacterium RBG_16_50_21]|nr:MAG: hypothetical protein A2Z27_04090 [candidate division Zixibacteria bacterium RBG_16_50_21]